GSPDPGPFAAGQPAPVEVFAGADGDGQWHLRGAGVEVLLDDHEQLCVQSGQCVHDFGRVGHSGGWFDAHAALDRFSERQPFGGHLGEHVRIHLFDVDVSDAFGVPADEVDVVAAAVGDVPGVQAEVGVPGVGGVQEPLDLDLGLDV